MILKKLGKMKASEFLLKSITDNSEVTPAKKITELDISRRQTSDLKKSDFFNLFFLLSNFLNENKEKFHIVRFGEEFEVANDLDIMEVRGSCFDDMKIITGNFVGTFIINPERFIKDLKFKSPVTININSRFGDRFLKYLIASSEGFLGMEDFGGVNKDNSSLMWLLIYYWKIKLKKALSLGLYKEYIFQESKERIVRGRIDFAHIHKFVFEKKLYCRYKEYSYENEINSVIKLALEKIFRNYTQFRSELLPFKRIFDELKIVRSSKGEVLNSYYFAYNEVYKLSLMILENKFFNVGLDREFDAILFDISLLFEHRIRRLLLENGFTINTKNEKEFTIPNGVGESNVYPDVVIYHSDGTVSVFDVKYKNFNQSMGVSREDRFQIVSYAALYGHKYKIKECGIIYPRLGRRKVLERELKICNERKIPFRVLFYPIATDDGFVKEQIKNEEEFMKCFVE